MKLCSKYPTCTKPSTLGEIVDANIYIVNSNGVERSLVSILPTDEVFAKGLRENAVLGHLVDPQKPICLHNVKVNPIFVSLFHKVVEATSIELEDCKEAARQQRQGFVYIIDARDRHHPNTKAADIIGAFAVENGVLQRNSYQANPNYQVVSEDGLFQLPEAYITNLLAKMRE